MARLVLSSPLYWPLSRWLPAHRTMPCHTPLMTLLSALFIFWGIMYFAQCTKASPWVVSKSWITAQALLPKFYLLGKLPKVVAKNCFCCCFIPPFIGLRGGRGKLSLILSMFLHSVPVCCVLIRGYTWSCGAMKIRPLPSNTGVH